MNICEKIIERREDYFIKNLYTLNLKPIISVWPSKFAFASSFKIEIYSGECKVLEPCQEYNITTNIELSPLNVASHNIFFKGFRFMDHVLAKDKFVYPNGQELKIQVRNFNTENVLLFENTPIGELIVTINR